MSSSVNMQPIDQIKAQLAAKPAQALKAPIITGVDVGALIKKYEDLLKGKPFIGFKIVQQVENNNQDAGRVNIRLTDQKNLLVEHIKNNPNDRTTHGIFFETTHKVIAFFMNLFACLFPCCVQGCAKFSVNNNGKDEPVFVRRVYLQDALPKANIERHAFNLSPSENTALLEKAALKHFTS